EAKSAWARSVLPALSLGTLLLALPLRAADLPARNLGFQSWSDRGLPADWMAAPGDAYAITRDCEVVHEGRCSLRIQSRSEGTQFGLPLAQRIAPDAAAGLRVKLSGWIRTRDVKQGWAGLWLRVEATALHHLASENMAENGPRGSTEWQRFEIGVPV